MTKPPALSLLAAKLRRTTPLGVVFGALLATGLGVSGMADAQVAQQYWECRAPSSGVEAGWCPVSTAYPPPISATGLVVTLATSPLPVVLATSPLPVSVTTALPSGGNNLGTVGGLEFNVGTRPTVTAGTYSAAESLGGLLTIPVGVTNSITGILTQISLAFLGGSTVAQVVYIWDVNPSNTTCTDRKAFVGSATDNLHLITGTPQSLVPALVASANDTTTYASVGNLVDNFTNSSTTAVLYACDLVNAIATPSSATDFRFQVQGIKDQP